MVTIGVSRKDTNPPIKKIDDDK